MELHLGNYLSKEFDQKSNQKQQNIKTFIEMFIHEGIKYRDKHCLFICRGGQPNWRCGLTAALPLLNCMTLHSRAQVNLWSNDCYGLLYKDIKGNGNNNIELKLAVLHKSAKTVLKWGLAPVVKFLS